MEAVGNIFFFLSFVLAIMCADWVGGLFSPGLYETLIELKGFPFLGPEPPNWANVVLRASDLMSNDVVTLRPIETVGNIIIMLNNTNHNCYPLVYPKETKRKGALFGTVMRERLVVMVHSGFYSATNNVDWDPDGPDAVSPVMDFQTMTNMRSALKTKDIEDPVFDIR